MHKKISVVKSNIHFLHQGIELLSSISDEQYAANNGKYFKSGAGKHFRHIIDHYLSLVEYKNNKVNYDDRQRDTRLEEEREFAISKMAEIIEKLESFIENPELIDRNITVQSNEGIGEEGSPWSVSSIRRELQFLISHTVHHYALIAFILKTMGVQPNEDFGVAPSTLKYEKEKSIVTTS